MPDDEVRGSTRSKERADGKGRLRSKERKKDIDLEEMDARELKKNYEKICKQMVKMKEEHTIPRLEYDDKESWKASCKAMEKAAEAFVYAEMGEIGPFPLKTLTNLEGMLTDHLYRILLEQHKPYAEMKAKEIRMAMQAASSAYTERVRDDQGFLLSRPYPDFNFSAMKHLLIGVCLEFSNSEGFVYKRAALSSLSKDKKAR